MGVGRQTVGGQFRHRRARERLPEAERRTVVLSTVRAYREAITAFAAMRNLELWYAHLSVARAVAEFTAGVAPKRLRKAQAIIENSRTKDRMHAFEKLTHLVDGEPRIISDPPLTVPVDELLPADSDRAELADEIRTLIRSYRRTLETDRRHLLEQFRWVDLARKVVGVGSVGTRADARSGDRVAIASYLGGSDRFDRSIATFAEIYAEQNERNYQALRDAVQAGRVDAEMGL